MLGALGKPSAWVGGVWVNGKRAAEERPFFFPFEQTLATEQELSVGVDKQLWVKLVKE